MRTGKSRILCLCLTLTLLFSMIPGMSLTAFAEEKSATDEFIALTDYTAASANWIPQSQDFSRNGEKFYAVNDFKDNRWLQFDDVVFSGKEVSFSADFMHVSAATTFSFNVYVDGISTDNLIAQGVDLSSGNGWGGMTTFTVPLSKQVSAGSHNVIVEGLPLTVIDAEEWGTTLVAFYAFCFIEQEEIVIPDDARAADEEFIALEDYTAASANWSPRGQDFGPDGDKKYAVNEFRDNRWLQFNDIVFSGKEVSFSANFMHQSSATKFSFNVYIDEISTDHLIAQGVNLSSGSGWGSMTTFTVPLSKQVSAGVHNVIVEGLPLTVHNVTGTWEDTVVAFYAFRFTRQEGIIVPDGTRASYSEFIALTDYNEYGKKSSDGWNVWSQDLNLNGSTVYAVNGFCNNRWLRFNDVFFVGEEAAFSADFMHQSNATDINFNVYLDEIAPENLIASATGMDTGSGWGQLGTFSVPMNRQVTGIHDVIIEGLPLTVNDSTVWGTDLVALYSFHFGVPEEHFRGTELQNYEKSWLGNNFVGTGSNGYGEWVQDYIENADFVNGTVVTASLWDEAGRCTGLYRDGKVNNVTLKAEEERANWGFGTANKAVAADENNIWIFTDWNNLLRFTWDYQNINSHSYVGYATAGSGNLAISMTDLNQTLYVLREGGAVESWNGISLQKGSNSFTVSGATQITADPKTGELWMIVNGSIKNYNTSGKALGKTISDVGKATYIGIDEKDGYLIVCDDGPRQQVLFYDISGSGNPTLVKTFGDLGGIGSGVPGEYKPTKLFALVGAGTDKDGNIYVTLSYSESVIRKFTPDGTLVWEEASFHFVDCADFLPGSDGEVVYGVDEMYEMDYSMSYGQEATITAITRDLVKYPGERGREGELYTTKESNVWARELDGKVVLFANSMHASNRNGKKGLDMYVFEDAPSKIAHYVGAFDSPDYNPDGRTDGNWAYDIDENGSIWVAGDNHKIIRYDFGGFDANGCPIYNRKNAKTFDAPAEFNRISRIIYDEASDRMFIFGYTNVAPYISWGLAGRVGKAYDWNNGEMSQLYSLLMPLENDGTGTLLDPKAVEVAGDYMFVCTARESKVHIYEAATGNYVGTMRPEPELGTSGWVDIPYGLRVTQRSNGEYVLLLEEGWRAKNIIYRWNPNPEPKKATSTFNALREYTEAGAPTGDGWANSVWTQDAKWNNKTVYAVSGFKDNRWLKYDDVKFSGAETGFTGVFMHVDAATDFSFNVYIDEISDENLIASGVDMGTGNTWGGLTPITVELTKPVTGTHSVIIEGLPLTVNDANAWGNDLIALYTFTFVDDKVPTISEPKVTLKGETIPAFDSTYAWTPGTYTVSVTAENAPQAKLYAALYDASGKLIAVNVADTVGDGFHSTDLVVPEDLDLEDAYMKVFVWRDDTMEPLYQKVPQ